jgi:hypothetical protein
MKNMILTALSMILLSSPAWSADATAPGEDPNLGIGLTEESAVVAAAPCAAGNCPITATATERMANSNESPEEIVTDALNSNDGSSSKEVKGTKGTR